MSLSCPRCDRPVPAQTVVCPYCKMPLTAYGHPGMPLYQAGDREYLCDRCLYHQDNSCTYPQRPYAKSCILFHDVDQPVTIEKADYKPYSWTIQGIKAWCYHHRIWLILLAVIGISLALTLLR